MRVLKTLFFSLLLIGIIGGIGFLITREVVLQIALSQISSHASQMQRIARNTGSYIQECQQKGSTPLTGSLIQAIQLRFTSSTAYALEVICSQYSLDPIVVETATLPPFVEKVAGSAGLTWRVEPSAISLTAGGRTRSIGITEEDVVVGLTPADASSAFGPVTSCSGYGYTCCQAETSVGQGDQVTTATDCPRTCFTSCAARPVILSVTTQPFLDQATRTVQLNRGEELSVGYVMDNAGLEGVVTTIDFGDGEQAQFTEINALAPHTYQCFGPSCSYQLVVSATAANGAVSAATPVTMVTVVVQ